MNTKAMDCFFHFNNGHFQDAFKAMRNMREHKELCDISLSVGELCINAHKVVLASSSPYFHAMFTNEMMEKNSQTITLHEVDSAAIELLVEYAYTSEIVVSENNVQVLLPAASLLQVNAVRDACCKFLMKQLHPSNCLGIRQFADAHSCEDLLKLSQEYILNNFVDVCETEEFLVLEPNDILELVRSEELNIANEEQVYNSVIKWVRHDVANRQSYTPEIMKHIRLPLLSREFLTSNVEKETIIKNNTQCKDYLIEAMKYHLLPEQRNSLQTERTKLRQCPGRKSALFAIGGGSLFSIHTECESYDPGSDQWSIMAHMTSRRARTGVAVTYNKLYAVGGYDGATDLSTAECYDAKLNKWTRIASMGTKRSCLGVCAWNCLIYAAGGYDGASCLNSVERYDPLTGTWSSVAAMTLRRRYLKLEIFDNQIWAIGGYDGSTHMASVERLDPQENKWQAAPSMISRRSNAGVAVLDNFLYVCGGNDGSNCLSSVEKFNPRRNIWEAVSSMHSRRSTHDVVVMDGYLYAVGGNDGSTSLNSAERYDPKTNRWTLVATMNLRRSSVGAAVLEVTSKKKT